MPSNPRFTKPGIIIRCRNIAVANTASDGSGTINAFQKEDGSDWVAGASGSRLEKISFGNSQLTPGASSAMVIRLWVSDATGTAWTQLPEGEVALATATRSATVVGAKGEVYFGGYDIDPGCKLGYTQSVYAGAQDQMTAIATVSDYTAE